MNNIITIPKKGEFVLIPREEYEEFLELKKIIPVVKLTTVEKRAVKRGRQEIERGEFVTLEELKRELVNTNSKKR